jgi:hypothetical protein
MFVDPTQAEYTKKKMEKVHKYSNIKKKYVKIL